MGVFFKVKLDNMKLTIASMEGMETALRTRKDELIKLRSDINGFGKGTHEIKVRLKSAINDVSSEAKNLHSMKEKLEDILRVYELTEAYLSGDIKTIIKIGGDKFKDILDDGKYSINDVIHHIIDSIRTGDGDIIGRIHDDYTRENMPPEYRERLQEIYDDVPPEYRSARDLYDKYGSGVEIKNYNENGAYYSNGDGIYINAADDMNNARGNGTTYYHEYGHYIVYEEGWIKRGAAQGEFADFEATLRREVEAYVKSYEDKYRAEAIAKGLTGAQASKYVMDMTEKAISKDINGPHNETYHVNNGLSDIIDGVTDGKYQPSYGHAEDYWSTNPSRVPNEAFAQIFSAQMTGDETELAKMREIFPEAYEKYCNMVANAANN